MKVDRRKDKRDENGNEEHNSKTDTHRKDPRRFTLVQIEDVGREIYFLVGKTHEQSTLDIDVSLVGPRSLAHQTKSKPIHGRAAQLRPVVEEVSLRIARVEDKLAFTGKLELPISKRQLVARRDAGRIAEHPAQHRREFPLQFFAAAEIVTNPHRSGFEILVVVASLEMQPAAIRGEGGLHILLVIGHDVSGGGDGKRPGCLVRFFGERGRRVLRRGDGRVRRLLGQSVVACEGNGKREQDKESHLFILPTPWSGPRESTQGQPSKYPPATGDARSCARRRSPSKTTSRWRWHWRLEGPVQRCA